MTAAILSFPVERRDVPQNTRRQINSARQRGECDSTLWQRQRKKEKERADSAIGDKVGSFEMGVIAAVLGSLNYGQALDTMRTAIGVAKMFPNSPGAQQALAYLAQVYPTAAASAAEVEARS